MVLIPLLDVLQSVPVLGYLSFTVVFFVSLFPGNQLGPELAAVFAIFTSQAWNMAFSFYNRFFDAIVKVARREGLLSSEHLTVDGTLMETWAGQKSFKPKDGPPPPPDGRWRGELSRHQAHQ